MSSNKAEYYKQTPNKGGKVYPGQMDESSLQIFQDKQMPLEEMHINFGKMEAIDGGTEKLIGEKDQVNQWIVQFLQPKQGESKATSKQENESRLESIYSGMILLRRLTRVIVQLIFIGLVIGFFAWGYFVTVKNSSWSSGVDISSVNIYVGNCFVNVSNTTDNHKQVYFSFKAKGSMKSQVNGSDDFRISGQILENNKANLTFYDPKPDLRTCIIDLKLPKQIDKVQIVCKFETTCALAFGLDSFETTSEFNATSEPKANLQINLKHLKTKYFNFTSGSSGNLFLNNFDVTDKANISLLSGDIVIQSTQSFKLTYTSQSHSICSSAFSIAEAKNESCYIEAGDANKSKTICKGSMLLCGKTSCAGQTLPEIIVNGNSSSIFANVIAGPGQPLIEGVAEKIEVAKTYPFQTGNLNFDSESILKIQQFLNKSGSADVAVRLDVGGHYLLQHTYSTQWAYFNNPSYAAFQPWWLSAFSATFLNPVFTHLQVSTDPGLCPWNPALNAKQSLLIQDLIKRTFNTTYGEAIFIQKDNFIPQNETLNSTELYPGFDPLTQKQRGKYENWSIIQNVANNMVYEPLKYDTFFIAAIALSVLSSVMFGIVGIFVLIVTLQGLETYVMETSAQFQNYSATTTQTTKDSLASVAKKMLQKIEQLASKKDPPILLGVLSYVFYAYGQSTLKSAPKMFFETIFKKSSEEQTAQFYKGTLDKIC